MNTTIRRSMFFALSSLCLGFVGCGDSGDDTTTEATCKASDEPKCDGKYVVTCVDGEWSKAAEPCEEACDGGACREEPPISESCTASDEPKCDGKYVVTCVDGEWSRAAEPCEEACDGGACREEPPISESCTASDEPKCDGDFVVTCDGSVWIKADTACPNGCDKGVCLEAPAETCDDGAKRCSNDYVQTCFNHHWVNASLKCPDGCEGDECKGDLNHNYMKDEFDMKDGKDCSRYADCDSGICDSFIGYKCSNKCTDDSQCISDEYFCRRDGRCAPKAFVTEWMVDKGKELVFPLAGANECKIAIDWGDGKTDNVTECKDIAHQYDEAGNYRISITGTLDGWKANEDAVDVILDKYHLIKVISFGPVRLGMASGIGEETARTDGAFYFADHLTVVSFIDIPDSSKLSSALAMFHNAKEFNSPIGNWDMHNVTSMTGMFENANSFNQPIGHWDTSSVKGMTAMFSEALAFNQPIGDWNVSNVESMKWMFTKAEVFNQPLNQWDVSKVTEMDSMFRDAKAFDQAIGDWDTSSVVAMDEMFSGAEHFNQDISKWNTSKVGTDFFGDMNAMFKGAKAFNHDIGKWDVSHVRKMAEMFSFAEAFDQDLSGWKLDALDKKEKAQDMLTGSGLSKANYCKLMSDAADAKWKEYIDVLGMKNIYSCD